MDLLFFSSEPDSTMGFDFAKYLGRLETGREDICSDIETRSTRIAHLKRGAFARVRLCQDHSLSQQVIKRLHTFIPRGWRKGACQLTARLGGTTLTRAVLRQPFLLYKYLGAMAVSQLTARYLLGLPWRILLGSGDHFVQINCS